MENGIGGNVMGCEFYEQLVQQCLQEYLAAVEAFNVANANLDATSAEVSGDLMDVYESWFTGEGVLGKISDSVDSFLDALESYKEFQAAVQAYNEAYQQVTSAESAYNDALDELENCKNCYGQSK